MRTQWKLAGWLGIAGMVGTAFAGTPDNSIGVGARPLAMGGAFVGLADDAHAIYWNPAGLPRLQRQEYTGMYAPNRFISNLNLAYGAATIPLGDNQAIGLDMMYESSKDQGLNFDKYDLRFSYGVNATSWLSLGANAKYVVPYSATLGDASNVANPAPAQDLGSAHGFGFDAGILADVGPLVPRLQGLRVGFMARDIGGTTAKHSGTSISETVYPASYTFGASYKLNDELTFAADLNDRLHFGVEYTILSLLSLRAGVQRDVFGYTSEMYYSAGAGIRWHGLRLDYAYQTHPTLGASQYIGFSFVYNPSYVTIKSAHVDHTPLYRYLYRYYESDPDFAQVTLKNTAQEPLKVNVGIAIPTMMEHGTTYSQDVTLPPQSTKKVTLGVALDDSILIRQNATFDNFVQPEVSVQYAQDRETKQAKKRLDAVYVLGRNKMTWSNPLRVAAFLTPEDPSIIDFGNKAIKDFKNFREENFDRCKNLGTAMILYDAIGKYGMTYSPDRLTPFYRIAADTANMKTIFDTVNFPTETMKSHLGDCSDLSVLFMTMLIQQSIPVALVDVFDPAWGHVYVMFDTGLTPQEAMATGLFSSEDDFIKWTDPGQTPQVEHAWIPVETTMFGQTFTDAWKYAVKEYHQKLSEHYVRLWSMALGREKYVSGVVQPYYAPFPAKASVQNLISLDIQRFNERLELPPLQPPITAEKLYQRGVELNARSQYSKAIEAFTEAIKMRPDWADAYNGRGVARNNEGGRVRYLTDDPARRRQQAEQLWHQAIDDFQHAVKLNGKEPGYWLNLMISHQLLDDPQGVREAKEKALDLDESLKPIIDDMERTTP